MSAAHEAFLSPGPRAERALLAAGLVLAPGGALALASSPGVTLRAHALAGGWLRHVSSPREAGRGAAEAAAATGTTPVPPGPFKVLPGPDEGTLVLAADFPPFLDAAAVSRAAGPAEVAEAGSDPAAAWAVEIAGGLAEWAGEPRGEEPDPPPLDTALLVERIRGMGWDASSSDGIAAVNLAAFRSFHRARFVPDGGRGVLIEAELARVEDPGRSWFEAALEVAREANEGLRLARVAVRRSEAGGSIAAEVHLGRLPLAGPWLPVALAAVEAAVSLLGREARALADPCVAGLVVSSKAFSRTASHGGGKEVP